MRTALSECPSGAPDGPGWASDEALVGRFVRGADEEAFAQLVQRHGPMVLGICRRTLGNHHDAEDAFQVTFELLARKAGSIRHRERLASWLYGVAQRSAMKLRDLRRRREEVERGAPPAPPGGALEDAWREVQHALDEEIGRLDEPLRAAIILCYLEGKTHEDAARELGRPLGSVSWLLGRALAALRKGLAGRGLTLTGGMSSLLLALQGPISIPPELLAATLRSVGALGTASPLAALIGAVLRDLPTEGESRPLRAAAVALLVVLGASAAGYKALASAGSPEPPAGQQSTSAGGCGGCSR
ncbi:MAG: sigma-70 family RNA polymerase sigma factor [Gemmataceae bacterium]